MVRPIIDMCSEIVLETLVYTKTYVKKSLKSFHFVTYVEDNVLWGVPPGTRHRILVCVITQSSLLVLISESLLFQIFTRVQFYLVKTSVSSISLLKTKEVQKSKVLTSISELLDTTNYFLFCQRREFLECFRTMN